MPLYVHWAKMDPPITEDEQENWAFAVGVTLMVADMRKVETDAEIEEILFRTAYYGRLFGRPMLSNARGEDVSTPEFWRRWRTVSINGVDKSRATWVNRMAKQAAQEIAQDVKRSLREPVTAS